MSVPRTLLTLIVYELTRPLIRGAVSHTRERAAKTARTWYSKEPDTLPPQFRCGACRGIGTTHMCKEAP